MLDTPPIPANAFDFICRNEEVNVALEYLPSGRIFCLISKEISAGIFMQARGISSTSEMAFLLALAQFGANLHIW